MATVKASVFVDELRNYCPSLKVVKKSDSWFMKVLGFLMKPINPNFMTAFVTTIGSTIYIPDKDIDLDEATSANWISVIGHEYVHISQSENHKLFKLQYMMPQVLGILGLAFLSVFHWSILPLVVGGYLLACVLAYLPLILRIVTTAVVVIAIGTCWAFLLRDQPVWFWAVLAGNLLCLAPLPAVYRAKYEMEAYVVSILIHQWLTGTVVPQEVTLKIRDSHFKGPNYYYMGWFYKDSDFLPLYRAASVKGLLATPTTTPVSTIYNCLVNLGYLVNPKT